MKLLSSCFNLTYTIFLDGTVFLFSLLFRHMNLTNLVVIIVFHTYFNQSGFTVSDDDVAYILFIYYSFCSIELSVFCKSRLGGACVLQNIFVT